ncbi:hypothetical protein [Pseudomonas segetis]|uniref:Tail fiber protein n=1 Tax=Pseudomonas segetis TaxID=298908 RepID=A0A239JQ61_9PSED|nr:hypothetical protein [Pseudomonas segetis]SNT07987.1 hypothetical protein SAMN05216255_4455 [Pseudomonas segetis]
MEKVGAYTDRVTDEGEWRSGNPASGQQATPMLAEYFNMLQREVVAVVEDDGTALDKADNGQLVAAIKRIAGKLFGERIATQPEVDAGARDDVSVTPKKLKHGLLYSFNANGYFFLPTWLSGFGFQWMSVTMPPSSTVSYPLPFAFPNSHFVAVGNIAIPAQATMNVAPDGNGAVRIQHLYATGSQAGRIFSVGR